MSFRSGEIVPYSYEHGSLTPNYQNGQPIRSNRLQLIASKIDNIDVFVQTINDKNFKHKAKIVLSRIIPSPINPNNVVHAGIIANATNGLHIIVEFGAYDYHREGDYNFQVHYYNGHDGLRFTQISDEFYEHLTKNSKNYISFNCPIRNKMFLQGFIIETMHFEGYHSWSRDSYNLVGTNCQYFVKIAIQVLGATRNQYEWATNKVLKASCPYNIMKALKDNEKQYL